MDEGKERLPIGRVAFAKTMYTQWVSGNSKTILVSALSLVATALFLYQISGRPHARKHSDFLHVDQAFQNWISQETQDPKVFQQLEKPLRDHPELQSKFGTAIAQRLLALGEVKKAEKYAEGALKRSQELNSGYYSDFSRNSLLIGQGKYVEALERARSLKVTMIQDDGFWQSRDPLVHSGTILYAYNLLRIAALERQLGSKEGELHAWEEFLQNAGWKGAPSHPNTYDPEGYALLSQNFTQGEISLNDYIQKRMALLSQ